MGQASLPCLYTFSKFCVKPSQERNLIMNMSKQRVTNMLNGPISSIFLIGAYDTGLTTEELARPYLSFQLATQSASFIERPNPDRLIIINRAKRVAVNLEEYALRMLSCNEASWWFDPIDLENQIWVSHSSTAPTPDAWGLFDDERGVRQTPTPAYITSTVRFPGTDGRSARRRYWPSALARC